MVIFSLLPLISLVVRRVIPPSVRTLDHLPWTLARSSFRSSSSADAGSATASITARAVSAWRMGHLLQRAFVAGEHSGHRKPARDKGPPLFPGVRSWSGRSHGSDQF